MSESKGEGSSQDAQPEGEGRRRPRRRGGRRRSGRPEGQAPQAEAE